MRSLLAFSFLVGVLVLIGCENSEVVSGVDADTSAGFPSGWEGSWSGPAHTGAPPSADKFEFEMKLHIEPIEGRDAWTWAIAYVTAEKQQVRAYELLPVDAEHGHWKIDEKNGIVIDAWLVRDTLYSRFAIADKRLEAHYQVNGDTMEVTLTTFGGVASKSGGEGEVPVVEAEKLLSVQRATLTRD